MSAFRSRGRCRCLGLRAVEFAGEAIGASEQTLNLSTEVLVLTARCRKKGEAFVVWQRARLSEQRLYPLGIYHAVFEEADIFK